jgi:hypothetical protein
MARLLGFLVGAAVGLGLCWLILSFEFSGGPSTVVRIHAFGVNIFTTSGILVDLVPAAVYVLLSGLLGIAGLIAGSRVSSRGTPR